VGRTHLFLSPTYLFLVKKVLFRPRWQLLVWWPEFFLLSPELLVWRREFFL
jgi:hypothetical protein